MPERTQFYKRGFVTSVRQHAPEKKQVEKEAPETLGTDLKEVLAKTPSERQKWLGAILRAAKEGKVKISLTAFFDILAHKKFSLGLPLGVGRKMRNQILDNSDIFSSKQQGFFRSDKWQFAIDFGMTSAKESRPDDSDSEEEKPPPPPPRTTYEDEDRKKVGLSSASSAAAAVPSEAPPPLPPSPQVLRDPPAPQVLRDPAPAVTAGDSRGWETVAPPSSAPVQRPVPPAPRQAASKPKRPAAVLAAFATESDDEAEDAKARAAEVAAMKMKQRKADLPSSDLPLVVPQQILRTSIRSERDASRSRERDRRRGSRADADSSGFSQVAFQKRRAASDKNPAHEGLDAIKAEYLQKRGLAPAGDRDRDRDRSRRRED